METHRLALIVEAMWLIMKEKYGLEDDELMARMAELDLSDGAADGKKEKAGPRLCHKCNRPNARASVFCLYCGELIRTKPFD